MENNFKKIGNDVIIHEDAYIKRPHLCSIGNHVAIDKGCQFSTQVDIGDYIHIAPYVVAIGGADSKVIFENFSFCASGTKIVAGSDDYTGKGLVGPTIPMKFREVSTTTVTFKKYSGCGVNCSIMPGVTIGEGAILGANSLATKDLEPWTIYVGSPAKPVRIRDKNNILKFIKELNYEF